MKIRLLLMFFSVSLFSILSLKSFAQARTISGTVTDSAGHPMEAVSVLLQGTKTGTQTKTDGSFSIQTTSATANTLVVSAVGYVEQQVPVTSGTITITLLARTNTTLADVVVVGYGTARKRDLTGSVTTVSSKDFQKGNITTPDQLIAGKVPGVVVTSNGGAPGAGSTIRIRGGASLNASNDPLIVVDGVPLDNTGVSGSPNGLSLINPNDIETFTILKDASAAAIYGNRASNGVIIITTKKGRSGGKLMVNFNTVNSISEKIKNVAILNGDEIRSIVNANGSASQIALLGTDTTNNTNWQDAIYRKAFSSDNNISLSGGLKNFPYRLSLGYLTQQGILKTSSLKRTSLAFNISPYLFNNSLHVDINVKGSVSDNNFADEGAIGSAVSFDPTKPVYAANKYGGYYEWTDASGAPIQQATRNPLSRLELRNSTSTVQRSIGNIQLDYKIPFLPELHANVNAGYDLSKSDGNVSVPANAATVFAQGGAFNDYFQYKRNELFDFYLNYTKDLTAIKSRIDATAGYEYQDFFRGAPASPVTDTAGKLIQGDYLPDSSRYTLVSFYGRLNYTFYNRYILTATLRRDGSSRFSPANHWGNFPSLAFAWRLKDEGFLKNSNLFSELKLRLGYGTTGNQDITSNNYPYLPSYTISSGAAGYLFGNTAYYTYRAEPYDPNIKWEHTTTYNAGFDYGFLNGRINGAIDVYYKKTYDLIADIPTANGANLSNHVLTNVGNIENKGIEFTINASPLAKKDFSWNVGYNITYNENKITKLSKLASDSSAGILTGGIGGGTGNSIQINSVSYPANSFYVYKQVYDANGTPIEGVYDNVNNNSNLFYRYKSPNPKVTMGFTSDLTYKKFNLSFVLRANLGNYMYNNIAAGGTLNGVLNTLGYIGNINASYRESNFSNSQYFSDYYVENASFLKMDNLVLGYNFGQVINKGSSLRVSLIAQNVFTITKYTGLDPEIYSGIDNNIYPRPRIFSIGANLGF